MVERHVRICAGGAQQCAFLPQLGGRGSVTTPPTRPSDDGQSLIGCILDAEQIRAVRADFGLDGGPAMTGAEAFEAALERGSTFVLTEFGLPD